MDDDILTEHYLPRVHIEEKKRIATGLIIVRENSSQEVQGDQQTTRALKTLLRRTSKPNKMITAAS